MRRATWTVLLLGSAALFASSLYRATTFPFTHDESLSFASFTWEPRWGATANNHLLNTQLMRLCSSLFGDSELSLRLPNVLAHLVYLVVGLLLLRRLERPLLRLAGFVLLNLNPFLLDFFSLARGYGLALAFVIASLYLLLRAHEAGPGRGVQTYSFLCAAAGGLAVLANLAFLTYYLPLLVVTAWLSVSDSARQPMAKRRLLATAALLAAGGACVVYAISKLADLRHRGELYFGGHSGFISDTVDSLVRASVYSSTYPATTTTIVSAVLLSLLGVLAIFAAWHVRTSGMSLVASFVAILTAAALLPILERYLFDVLWPIERSVLYLLPLFAVAVLFTSQVLSRDASRRWRRAAALGLPVLMGVLLCWQFSKNFSLHSSYDWWYDRHDKQVLAIVRLDRERHRPGRNVALGDSWVMEPSLNFYRVTHGYTWLMPVTRHPVTDGTYDYVYGFTSDVSRLAASRLRQLASYPDTDTILVRVDR